MTCKTKNISEIQKTEAVQSSYARKTKKISRKKNSSKTGLSNKEMVENLISNISIAKGVLAILSSKLHSLSTRPLAEMIQADQIRDMKHLSQDLTDEICSAEETLINLRQSLLKRFAGICLF